MKINEIKCKTALSKSSLPGLDYSLNPYKGCQHNCAYCYVPNVLRINRKDWGGFVDVKTNMPIVLSKELKKKKKGVVGISTVTDPYQPIEKNYKLTRYCLEQILIHDFPVCIQTKSDLVIRDIDIISNFSKAELMFSIGTLNDDERKILEPFSSPIQNRLDALKQFSNEGIKACVFFGPIYPSIKKEDLSELIDTFVKYGAREIMVDKFNFKPGIYQNLKKFNISKFERIKDESYFKEILNEMEKNGKERKIKIVTAF